MNKTTQHFYSSLIVEFKKQRHLNIGFVPLAFWFLLFLWALYVNKNPSAYEQSQGYSYMLYQLPIMNCIVMPIMLSVIASRLCDMELNGQTLKLLYTLQEKYTFYKCKFLHELLYLLLFSIGEGLLILLIGKLYHFTEPLSISLLLLHIGITILVGSTILTLQHFLSLISQTQILPLLIGLIGSFLGLFSLFFPPAFAKLVLWGYFAAFPTFQMNWEETSRIISFESVPFPYSTFFLFLLFSITFYFFCRNHFLKKEV